MPDIYTTPELIERRWKTRAKKIVISNPSTESDGKKEIIFDVEDVPYDNNIPKFDESKQKIPLKVDLSSVASEIFTVYDPVTGQNINISVLGIANAIEESYVAWQKRSNS